MIQKEAGELQQQLHARRLCVIPSGKARRKNVNSCFLIVEGSIFWQC